jgi:TonB family protein
VVDVLRTIGDTKVLASPRIIVLNNQEAKIHVGSREAYITSTTTQSASGPNTVSQAVNFVDIGTKLYVTPTISSDDFITMKIKPEISTSETKRILSDGVETEIPIVTTSEAETVLMVKDGVTIIIGGLKKDNLVKTVKKIPFLGDIPLLGWLFKSNTETTTKSELIILLTPHIMSGEKSYVDSGEIKPKDGAVVSMVKGEIVMEKMPAAPSAKENISPKELKSNAAQVKLSDEAVTALVRQYYNLVMNKISGLTLTHKSSKEKGKAEVLFTLDSSGKLKGVPSVSYSNNPALNDKVIKCVEAASPFAPFPKEINKIEEDFSIVFEYK